MSMRSSIDADRSSHTKLDSRYFQGLEGIYSFSLEFRLKSVGSDAIDFLTSPKISAHLDLRSVNCEIDLKPGAYEVIPRVTASHCPWNQPVEQVVKEQIRRNPAKLRQVGLRYDLAHSKAGLLDEDEIQKKKRQEERRKEREKPKDGPPNQNGYLEQVVQRIVTTVQEEVRKLGVSDNNNKTTEEDKEKGRATQRTRDINKEGCESPSEWQHVPPIVTKPTPGCWPDDLHNDTKDKSVRVSEDTPTMQRTPSKMEGEARIIDDPEKPVKEVVVEEVPLPIPLPPPVTSVNQNDIPAAENTDDSSASSSSSSSSSSDSDSESWSDSDSDMDGSEVGQRWNPVCVMCLRVYAQDKEVSIKLVESGVDDEKVVSGGQAPSKGIEKQPKAEQKTGS